MAESLAAETLTRVLYPDDSTSMGQGLRFVQEYFLVACSLADIVRRFRRNNSDWNALPEKVAIQLNDTHPSMSVPELMRILLDDAHLDWDQAWDLTQRTLAYTNHTLLPEALEKWPVAWFEMMLPRHLEIIFEINRRLLDDVRRAAFPAMRAALRRVSLIEEGPTKQVRMANLAIVGSHSTNGVARSTRSCCARRRSRTWPKCSPSDSTTRPTASRRGAGCCWPTRRSPARSPKRSAMAGSPISVNWTSSSRLADDKGFRNDFRKAKREAKTQFADWLKTTTGQTVDPDTIFDCQIKRIHEYKRQLLNALRIVVLYNRLRQNPSLDMPPRTFFFAGKAAPAYHLAKVIIKFINNLAAIRSTATRRCAAESRCCFCRTTTSRLPNG